MARSTSDIALDCEDALRAMRSLGSLINSRSGTSEDLALKAIQADRTAYMSCATYHNATAGLLVDLANETDLASALNQYADPRGAPGKHPLFLLGTLIPLNIGARFEIERLRQIELDAHVGAAIANTKVVPLSDYRAHRESKAQRAVTSIMAAE